MPGATWVVVPGAGGSAHGCSSEITVALYDDVVTVKPGIHDGYLHRPTGPGWGTEVDEEACAHIRRVSGKLGP